MGPPCVSFQGSNLGVGHKIPLLSVSSQLAAPNSLECGLKIGQNILALVDFPDLYLFFSFPLYTGLGRDRLPLPFSVGWNFSYTMAAFLRTASVTTLLSSNFRRDCTF